MIYRDSNSAMKLFAHLALAVAMSGCAVPASAEPELGSTALNGDVDDLTVLVVGDSLAKALGDGMAAVSTSRNVTVVNAAIGGCGLMLPVEQRMNGKLAPTDEECNSWPTVWQDLVEQHRPDAVYLTTSFWDAAPQTLTADGEEGTLDDPAFQDRWVENATRAISILEHGGATVYLDDLNPDQLHGVQRRVVDESDDSQVVLLPLFREMCTETVCPTRVDGIPVLDDTGHPAGESRDRWARWLLNEMADDLSR